MKIMIFETSTRETLEEIDVEELAHHLEFYNNGQAFIALTESTVIGYDLITLAPLFEIKKGSNPWGKVQMLPSEDMIVFEDCNNKLVFFDLLHKCIRAETKPLKTVEVPIYLFAGERVTHNTAWCILHDSLFI